MLWMSYKYRSQDGSLHGARNLPQEYRNAAGADRRQIRRPVGGKLLTGMIKKISPRMRALKSRVHAI